MGRVGQRSAIQQDSRQYYTAAVVQVPGIFTGWYASYIGGTAAAVIVNIVIAKNYRRRISALWAAELIPGNMKKKWNHIHDGTDLNLEVIYFSYSVLYWSPDDQRTIHLQPAEGPHPRAVLFCPVQYAVEMALFKGL